MKREKQWPRTPDEQLDQMYRIDEQFHRMRRHDDWRNARYLFWRRILFYLGGGLIAVLLYAATHVQ